MSDDASKEFQTYLFFLRHFIQLVRQGRGRDGGDGVVAAILAEQAPRLTGVVCETLTPDEVSLLRKYLFTSWNSEAIARLSSLYEPEVRRFTNQWKPIQCYYAMYFQLVAIHYVATRRPQRAHEPTIRYATNSVVHRLPSPWRCRLDYDNSRLVDFPPGTAMVGHAGWNLANNEPYFHTACFLRRTGFRKQVEVFRDLRLRKRKIPAGRARAGKSYRSRSEVEIGFVSIFDVLWRFRTWANYHEGDTVIDGGEYQDHAVEFDASFNELTDTTAGLCEQVLVRSLGADAIRPIYTAFLALTGNRIDTLTIGRRRHLLCP